MPISWVVKPPLFPVHRKIRLLRAILLLGPGLKHTMTLLLALDTGIFPQEFRGCVKYVFHKFVKCPTIPAVKSKQYARACIFGVIFRLRRVEG